MEEQSIFIEIKIEKGPRNGVDVKAIEVEYIASKTTENVFITINEEGKREFKAPNDLNPLYKVSRFIESDTPGVFVPKRK